MYASFSLVCQTAESRIYWKPGYQAVNATTGHQNTGRTGPTGAKRIAQQVLPALLAIGSGFVACSASALELGDIRIESKLGQPLRASIAYTLNPNEQIFDYCISLRPGVMASGIPSISKARISVTAGTILLTGNLPIREPALGMRVTVNCPYTAQLARDYTLMIDPGLPVGGQQMVADAAPAAPSAPPANVVAAASKPQVVTPVTTAKPTPTPMPVQSSPAQTAVAASVDQSPIATNSQYFVQPGDSLFGIATRIQNRQTALRPAADAIFAANPDAFTDHDINRLAAGIWIAIPDFLGAGVVAESAAALSAAATSDDNSSAVADDTAPQTAADALPAEVAEPVVASAVAGIAPVAAVVEEVVVEEPAAVEEARFPATPIVDAVEEAEVAAAAPVETMAAASEYVAENTADLRPGDVVIGDNISTTSTDGADSTAGDVVVEPETTVRAAPVVSLPSADTAGDSTESWLVWIGGAGLGVLFGLVLFFGRRIKARFGSAPIQDPTEQLDDDLTDEVEVLSDFDPLGADETYPGNGEQSIVADVDFQLDDSMISSQSISLDADLGIGTGLQNVSDVDVAQDFGFSASNTGETESAMDLELPEEAPEAPEKLPTDIIPPNHRIEDSILDSEEAPATDASAEYDLSMIVDATKQALGGDDLTAKDLMAVQVGAPTGSEADGNEFTLNKRVDIQALEQDYQDEYTATLAMNGEIEQAAIDLALRLDESDSSEVTSKLPSVADATQTEAVLEDDMPTEIASLDDEIDDLEDTGVNPQLTARMPQPGNEPTVEMPQPGAEPTVEMPQPGSEPTVEMEIESGKVDSKKSQAS